MTNLNLLLDNALLARKLDEAGHHAYSFFRLQQGLSKLKVSKNLRVLGLVNKPHDMPAYL